MRFGSCAGEVAFPPSFYNPCQTKSNLKVKGVLEAFLTEVKFLPLLFQPYLNIFLSGIFHFIYVQCIFFECLSSVCFYPINVRTAEPISPKFCVATHKTTGKIYGPLKLKFLPGNLLIIIIFENASI